MNIEVVKVLLEEKQILDNLLKMYCYEWSQYNKFDVNHQGEYEFEYQISDYWDKENHYPYFVKVNGILAGFVLIDGKFELYLNHDYEMAEFFIMYKYRRAGVGRYVAKAVFDMFHGKWEIGIHPHNITSLRFWGSIVDEYTDGKYEIMKSCHDVVYHDGTCADIISFEN
ncbi:MAG TPA: GNAT family N-acetyltransferase [Clostridia bacterium]|nr:GNAT family N-acetyltransferase [Clostridia bacterium]